MSPSAYLTLPFDRSMVVSGNDGVYRNTAGLDLKEEDLL